MRRLLAIFAVLFLPFGFLYAIYAAFKSEAGAQLLCSVGVLRHRPRRAGIFGGWRCERCGKAGADLDDLGEIGAGYVNPLRTVHSRDGAFGHAETTSDEWTH